MAYLHLFFMLMDQVSVTKKIYERACQHQYSEGNQLRWIDPSVMVSYMYTTKFYTMK